MKNYLSLFVLTFCIQTAVFGYKEYYIQNYPYSVCTPYNYCYPNRNLTVTPYNPYWAQKNVTYSKSHSKKIKKIRKFQRRRLNRVSWLFKNNNQGGLTGYSVPISGDIYKQMGISPYNPKSKERINSPTCNQELFSIPAGDETYYKNGKRYGDLKGASGKAGVSIIYD